MSDVPYGTRLAVMPDGVIFTKTDAVDVRLAALAMVTVSLS